MRLTLLALAVVCVLGMKATAQAETSSQGLIEAIDAWDVRALQAIADQASDPDRQALAHAVLQAFAGRDTAASTRWRS